MSISHTFHHDNEHHEKSQTNNSSWKRGLILAGLGATVAGLSYYMRHNGPTAFALELNSTEIREPGSFLEGLPIYTSEDVAKHRDESTGIWISYKNGVYDITKFVTQHPGELQDT